MSQAAPIQHITNMFQADDGLHLLEQTWQPAEPPKATLVFVHGFCEHSARYAYVAQKCARRGFAFETFDLRGHGGSEGRRAFVRAFDQYVDDLETFVTRVRERRPNGPYFLVAHSMGGTIASLFVLTKQHDFKGLVLSGAALKVSRFVPPILVHMTGMLAALFPALPTVRLGSGDKIIRDPAAAKRYDDDPYVHHGGAPARTGAELLRAIHHIRSRMQDLQLPLFVLHGTEDTLIEPDSSRQLYARAGAPDKTLNLYDGWYHELLTDACRDQVLSDILQWLETRL